MNQVPADGRQELLIGVVSDTHGLLRPQVPELLRGCDLIIHAGDVGGQDVLDSLGQIAPVHAVRGNTDHGPWAATLPETEVVAAGAHHLYVLHDISRLDLDPAGSFQAVIFGHSHKPAAYRRAGVLYLNPGSIGPRRFSLPISLALLQVRGESLHSRHIQLDG